MAIDRRTFLRRGALGAGGAALALAPLRADSGAWSASACPRRTRWGSSTSRRASATASCRRSTTGSRTARRFPPTSTAWRHFRAGSAARPSSSATTSSRAAIATPRRSSLPATRSTRRAGSAARPRSWSAPTTRCSRTGIAYLTEDDFQNAIPDDASDEGPESRVSFLYRYLPDNRAGRPGALQDGGKLQVMTVDFISSFNVDVAHERDRFGVVWRDVDPADPRAGAVSVGAARFQRLEGCHFAGGAFWFDDTAGGEKRNGQVFRLIPSGDPAGGGRDDLELHQEGDSVEEMDSPDNLVVTPWGDLWYAEDGDGIQRVMGITPDGAPYEFARNRLIGLEDDGTSAEFCGPTFSPDGRTLFLNVQHPGHTFAITGPFPRRDAGRRRELAMRAPRHARAPRISGEMRETAERLHLSPYEVAAYIRLGVDLSR